MENIKSELIIKNNKNNYLKIKQKILRALEPDNKLHTLTPLIYSLAMANMALEITTNSLKGAVI